MRRSSGLRLTVELAAARIVPPAGWVVAIHGRSGEPVSLMSKNHIPMLLIQSKHDGLIEYGCAEDFAKRAEALGNFCELYEVKDKKNTHSWYTAGMFLETRKDNMGLDKFFTWIEEK